MSSKDATTHPDFSLPWIHHILTHPQTTIHGPLSQISNQNNNQFFGVTLSNPTSNALKAAIFLERPSREPDSLTHREDIYILSIDSGVDGAQGRAHGGFNSLVLDHITGTTANRELGGTTPPPATAYLNVQYKAPVNTPCVLIARAWMTRMEGRKVFLKGVLEDGEGKVYATGEALYIGPRKGAL